MSNYAAKTLDDQLHKVRTSSSGSRNNTLYRAAVSVGRIAESTGLNLDEAVDMLYEAAYVSYAVSPDKASRGSRDEIRNTVRSGIKKGMADPIEVRGDIGSRPEAEAEVVHVLNAFMAQRRGGHRGNRTYPVMVVVCFLALAQGGPRDVRASMRKVQVLAGLGSASTVCRAVNELIEEGYLTRNLRGDASRGATYNLGTPTAVRGANTPTPHPGVQGCFDLAQVGHDAFHQRALGRLGQRVLGYLSRHVGVWFTQSALARDLGVCASSISRHVRVDRPLVELGLLERDQRGRVRLPKAITPTDLDFVAFACRTRGKGDRVRRRLVQQYIRDGFLTEDLRWINQQTGEATKHRADWLEPTATASASTARRSRAGAPSAVEATG